MAITIKEYLKDNNKTLTDVAKNSGISKSTLSAAFRRPVENWTVKILNAISMTTNESPSSILAQLQDKPFSLQIDDDTQTIQGVRIPNYYDYALIRATVKISCMEGWKPTPNDIQELLYVAKTPQPELEKEFKEVFGEDNEVF